MQSNIVSVFNRHTRNDYLSDIEPPVNNLTKDKQKYQIKYRHHVLHTRIPITR